MLLYLGQRIALFVATLVFASLVVFAVMQILPGDAAQTMLGPTATPEAVAALSHKLGLDLPAPIRYARWIGGALHGDLGLSYAYGSPIGPLIASSLAVSAPLALMAMTLAAIIGLAAGVYAADRRGRAGDAIVMGFSQIGIAVPNFWLAILLVLVFAVTLRLVPAGGFPGWAHPARAFGALILPAIALGVVQAAIVTRVTRSAVIEALNEDFMRTARAKGVSRRAALWRHALPNALTPILTIMGLQFANLIAGAIVVENVFVLPGLGRLMLQSISNRDTLVVENGVMLLAMIVIGLNFIVDLACAAIDPRLRALRGVTVSARFRPRGGLSLWLGAVLVATLIVAAALSLIWTPYPPSAIDIPHKLAHPSAAHWFGTDNLGRDVASQILAGSRVSILVGVIAVGIGLVFGVVLGLVAAFSKGLVEDGLMKLSDFVFAFPALLLAIMLTATFGPGVVNAIIAIGVYNVPIIAKLTRATANGVLSREYALAARAAGRGPIAIAIDHVLPNIAPALIVQATIQFAIAILAEAALSYLGLGAQPPETSWGKMLADAQNVLYNAPRLAFYPGIAIALSVLGLNLLGDGLRDALDPKLKARS